MYMSRSLLVFSNVTFRMAAWWPYWIFRFPDLNFSLALSFNSKLQWQPIDFQQRLFQNGRLATILDYLVSGL